MDNLRANRSGKKPDILSRLNCVSREIDKMVFKIQEAVIPLSIKSICKD
jgi:hypothetical protein